MRKHHGETTRKNFSVDLFFSLARRSFARNVVANGKLLGTLMALLFVDVVEREEWGVCADQIRR